MFGTHFQEVKVAGFMGGAGSALQGRLPAQTGVQAIPILDGRLENLAGPVRLGGYSLLCRPNHQA